MGIVARIFEPVKLVAASVVVSCALLSAPVDAQSSLEYRLNAGDEVEVSVWGEQDLQRVVLIRPDGRFTFPLAGEIAASGHTVSEVQSALSEALAQFIPEAVVTVSITRFEGNQVFVIGQVQNPGRFVMSPQLNVIQALSLAGGMTPFAAVNDIIVIRGDDGEQRVFEFRYDDITNGRDLEQNIQLVSGDVVIVP